MALTTGIATDLLTFARSGTKRRFNSAGLLVEVADGVLALDHDAVLADVDEPTLKRRLGASVEGAATPLFQYSEDFSNAYWTKSGCTITADATAAPDGTTTMDKIVEGAGSVTPTVFRANSGITAGLPYLYSIFAKKAERTRLNLICTGGFGINATFDLDAGTVESLSVGDAAAIIDCGGDIYRCAAFDVASATTVGNVQARVYGSSGTPPYTGDGASGLYVWGANFVQSGLLSTYVPRTGSAAASRSADSLTLPVADIAPWSTTRGVVEISARAPHGIAAAVLWQVDDGSEDNRLRIERDATGDLHCIVTAGGVAQADLDLGAVAGGADFSVAFAWASDDFAASLDGAAAVTDTSGSVPSGLTTMRFGHSFTGEHWSSTVKSVLYSVP